MANKQQQHNFFTPKVMKEMAIFLITLDLILFLLLMGGEFAIISQLEVSVCFTEIFIVHFLILLHFALAMQLTNIVDGILKREAKLKSRNINSLPSKLPYNYYSPLSWSFTSVISFLSDLVLLTYSIRQYIIGSGLSDACQTYRVLHIAFDSMALLVSLLSIIWFLVFSFNNIENIEEMKKTKIDSYKKLLENDNNKEIFKSILSSILEEKRKNLETSLF